MIGLNGSLVAVLCIAYFVLIACALAFGRTSAADGDQAMIRSENEQDRRRRQHSFATTRQDSALPAVVTYARTTTDDEAAARRVAQMIDDTVLSLRPSGRSCSVEPRAARCERRTRPASQRSLRP
jgi:hypothetical protein